MSDAPKFVRVASLKTAEGFASHVAALGIELPCETQILTGSASPLAQPLSAWTVNGKRIGNRFAIHPMEGWDAATDGAPTPHVHRRWQRFGQSGAKLIWGGEAMAVVPEARANPNQLIIDEAHQAGLAALLKSLLDEHTQRFGHTNDLVVGFQLTHSGRFCKPTDPNRMEPRVACRHPLLDPRFKVVSDRQMITDDELDRLIECYVVAARVAWNAGADFVDIKHCHGYLLHELLGAFARAGKYGGSFENRTRFLRDTVAAIRASGNPIEIGVRLSAFDFVPFKPDPERSRPGKPGPGVPEDYRHCLPYVYGFGVNQQSPTELDLSEPIRFLELCRQLGIRLVNLSAGSPYYNPHIQRPAAYPPSDGYQPPEDPLVGVARQVQATRRLKQSAPDLLIVGTGYSYLQEFLPLVAQFTLRNGWVDSVGIGRMALSYPEIFTDALERGTLTSRKICRTFSDCTTAPRNGLVSGCYPLDEYYAELPEAQRLKAIRCAASQSA